LLKYIKTTIQQDNIDDEIKDIQIGLKEIDELIDATDDDKDFLK
jgi:hypothetical protein